VSAAPVTVCSVGVCAGSPGTAGCGCSSPPTDCSSAGTVCRAGNLATCDYDINGCLVTTGTAACQSAKTCMGSFPSAQCSCPPAPAVCMGATSGTVCSGTSGYYTCTQDAAGCVSASALTTCSVGLCSGATGSAACTCPAAPSDCASAGTVCRAGSLATCGLNANGCLVTTGTATCPNPQTCGGAFPAAQCACPTETLCDAANEKNGNHCSATASLTTCAATNTCQVASTTNCTNVANELCSGSYPNAKCEKAYGMATDGGGSVSLAKELLFGIQVTVAQPLTLTRFGLIARAASAAHVRMAIYTANSGTGQPDVWQASALGTGPGNTVANGRNEYAVNDTSTGSPVTLPAGTYWIFAVIDTSGTNNFAAGANGPARYKDPWAPWNTPFPSPIGQLSSSASLPQPNFYIVGVP